MNEIVVRALEASDGAVIERLAERTPHPAILTDDRTIFVAAFDGAEPVGFAFGYVLPRRHGPETMLFVYEVEVDDGHRRRGIAKRLLQELEGLARARGAAESFVLTKPDNDAANALYGSLGGTRSEVVEWDWTFEDD